VLLLLLLLMLTSPVLAEALQSGAQVYRDGCRTCHGSGLVQAPRYGDAAEWGPRLQEGQATLTAHGWVGVRAMPPKGGMWDLSLQEFARAVAFMARAAGADWQDPDAALLARIEAEVSEREAELREHPGGD
jgi:cytochrome c5